MNLFAYTGSGSYPEYVSVNLRDGAFEITVRSPGKNVGEWIECGESGTIRLTEQQIKELLQSLSNTVSTNGRQ